MPLSQGEIGGVSSFGRALAWVYAPAQDRRPWLRIALFAAWLALVLFLTAHHVMWRDEVRAFSLALRGDTILQMPAAARGMGHPLLWHILLRAAHDLIATPLVLPIVSIVVAAAAMAVLLRWSPLSLPLVALTMFGGFGSYMFVVFARNYGLSMLLLFALAALYPRYRRHSPVLGVLLALLCNSNVHSVVLAGGFYLFWCLDLVAEEGWGVSRAKRVLLGNGAILAVGVAACFWSVWPSVEDTPGIAPRPLADTLTLLIPGMEFHRIFGNFNAGPLVKAAAALLVSGSLLSFARRPAALAAAVATLAVLQALFVFLYPGQYRHVVLIVVFFLTLHWLVAGGFGGRWDGRRARVVERVGQIAFLALMAAQLPATARAVVFAVQGRPEGEARALATLLKRPDLAGATLISEPEGWLETMPYYVANPIWSLRQGRPATVMPMERATIRLMTPHRLLASAQEIAVRTRRPVVILLADYWTHPAPRTVTIDRQGYDPLVLDPAGQAAFLRATRPLASLHEAVGDERYDVRVLEPPAG